MIRVKSTPPEGRLPLSALGVTHTCGLKEDGSVSCWGSNVDYDGKLHRPGQVTER